MANLYLSSNYQSLIQMQDKGRNLKNYQRSPQTNERGIIFLEDRSICCNFRLFNTFFIIEHFL